MSSILIPLHSQRLPGLYTVIDEEDADRVQKHRWYPSSSKWGPYAYTTIERRSVFLHRLITGATPGEYVDHINHDKLDNRRSNLRLCTNSQNNQNRSCARSDSGTGILGVYVAASGRFRSRIRVDGRFRSIGTFDTIDEAIAARIAAEDEFFGEFAPQRSRTTS
jgi:hypothetical protein